MAVQADHDLPDSLLFGPGGEDAGGARRTMPSISRSRSGVASITSKTLSPKARTSLLA